MGAESLARGSRGKAHICVGYHIAGGAKSLGCRSPEATVADGSQWRQPMLTNRAFLLACATIATLGLAAMCSTPADARPCHTADSTPREEKACLLRSAITAAVSEAAEQAARARQAAMEKQAAAKQAAMAKQVAAKQAATNAPA